MSFNVKGFNQKPEAATSASEQNNNNSMTGGAQKSMDTFSTSNTEKKEVKKEEREYKPKGYTADGIPIYASYQDAIHDVGASGLDNVIIDRSASKEHAAKEREHAPVIEKKAEKKAEIKAEVIEEPKQEEKKTEKPKTEQQVAKKPSTKTEEKKKKEPEFDDQTSLFEDLADWAANVDLDKVKKNASKAASKTISSAKSKTKKAVQKSVSHKQDNAIKNKFREGRTAIGCYYKFKILDREAMIVSYSGPAKVLKLPSYVLGRPITAINACFLRFHTAKSLSSSLDENNIMQTDVDSLTKCFSGVEQLRLPKKVTYLPSSLFSNCKKLKIVVVPASVTTISSKAFYHCKLQQIIFLGKCPVGLKHAELPEGAKIICTEKYKDTFAGISGVEVQRSIGKVSKAG